MVVNMMRKQETSNLCQPLEMKLSSQACTSSQQIDSTVLAVHVGQRQEGAERCCASPAHRHRPRCSTIRLYFVASLAAYFCIPQLAGLLTARCSPERSSNTLTARCLQCMSV